MYLDERPRPGCHDVCSESCRMCSLQLPIALPPRSANEGQTVRHVRTSVERDVELRRIAYVSGLVVLEIANRKLAEEAVVVFLSELVVPGGVLCLGRGVVFAQELVGSLEDVEFCGEGLRHESRPGMASEGASNGNGSKTSEGSRRAKTPPRIFKQPPKPSPRTKQ